MFKSKNPLFKLIEDSKNTYCDIKNIYLNGFYMSSIQFIVFSIIVLQLNIFKDNWIYLIFSVSCLLLTLFLLYQSTKTTKSSYILSILYSFFQAAFIAFLSLYLYNQFSTINNGSVNLVNSDSYIFLTIGFTVVFTSLLIEILYSINFSLVNNFFYKIMIIYLFIIVFATTVTLLMSSYINGYNFWPNILCSLLSSLIIEIFTVIYIEEARKIVNSKTSKTNEWKLSLAPIIAPIWWMIDIFSFNNRK